MLNFKEYTLMSFKNIFQERFKNHFLKNARKDIFKYQYDAGFLSSLSVGDDNSKAIQYFTKLIDTNNLYTSLYNTFVNSLDKSRSYYRFAAYYMKQQNYPKSLSKLDATLTKQQNALIALKEIFANELYEHLIILNKGEKNKQKTSLDDIKKNITKTFVVDNRVAQSIERFNLPYYFYTYFDGSRSKNFGDENFSYPIDGRPSELDLLFNGINMDRLTPYADAAFPTLKKETLLYNNAGLKFENRIFNQAQYTTNLDLSRKPNGSLKVVEENKTAYLPTTQKIKYDSLLKKDGAYIEFYFKYDNIFREGSDVKIFETDQSIAIAYSNENKTNLPQEVNYFSFREMLAYCLYLKSAMTPASPSVTAFTSPALLSPHINFKFGARLVVEAPGFETFVQNDIAPKSNYLNKYDKPSPGQGEINVQAVEPDQLLPNVADLLKDANSYADKNNIVSPSKNKTFVYNLLDQEIGDKKQVLFNGNPNFSDTLKTWYEVNYEISSHNPVILGEYEIKLTQAETENFLKKISNLSGPINYIDFIIDQDIIEKYYGAILEGIFSQDLIKDYLTSDLNSIGAVAAAYISDESAYNSAVAGTILESGSPDLTEEANKTDNIIDQNLITLIDSVEAF